jgi:hypothetical protein
VTRAEAVALVVPSVPTHVTEYGVVTAGVTVALPLVAETGSELLVQDCAFVALHDTVADCPAVMLAGEADTVTTGVFATAGPTDTVTDWLADPSAPVQVTS